MSSYDCLHVIRIELGLKHKLGPASEQRGKPTCLLEFIDAPPGGWL